MRTPSGIGYWIAAREATLALLDPPDRRPIPIEAAALALRNVLGPGNAIVLTDGQDNAAFWEHAFLAERMDVPLAVPADLEVRDGRFHLGGDARRRHLPPHERRRGGQHGGHVAPAGRSGRRREAGQLPRHGRRRRQARPRLRPRHDPLLPRRDPAAGAGGDVRPRRAGDARARARRLRRAGHQGPRLLRRHRRLHRAARRARGRRGAARAGRSPRPRITSPSAWSASPPIRRRSTECLRPAMSTCDRSC